MAAFGVVANVVTNMDVCSMKNTEKSNHEQIKEMPTDARNPFLALLRLVIILRPNGSSSQLIVNAQQTSSLQCAVSRTVLRSTRLDVISHDAWVP